MSQLQGRTELESWCETLVRELGLSFPLRARALCTELSRTRRREIVLRPGTLPSTGSGWLLRADQHDLIVFHEDASESRSAHVIFHELVHLLRGHLEKGEMVCRGVGDFSPEILEAGYRDQSEWEAETGATFLSEMSRRRPEPAVLPSDATAADLQVASTFGVPRPEQS